MKANNTNEQLDLILKLLVASAAADESTIDEVVDSPTLWRGVSRRIQAPRPTVFASYWQWLLIGAPALAAALLLAVLFTSRQESPAIAEQAISISPEVRNQHLALTADEPDRVSPSVIPSQTSFVETRSARRQDRLVPVSRTKLRRRKQGRPTVAVTPPTADVVRSEFITLSYARDPESGQIVRVKVPRSMMVTVGLVASVDKPTSLVDAEVLVGDDGLNRAIRFIR
jgi:hypothetical protein